jgi:hypothetical protein
MFEAYGHHVSATMAQAAEDAILFGHVRELDILLDRIEDDKDFPDELRYGLQALRYFRAYYGKDGVLEPEAWLQKQKIAVMESAWGSELLELLTQSEEVAAKRA